MRDSRLSTRGIVLLNIVRKHQVFFFFFFFGGGGGVQHNITSPAILLCSNYRISITSILDPPLYL